MAALSLAAFLTTGRDLRVDLPTTGTSLLRAAAATCLVAFVGALYVSLRRMERALDRDADDDATRSTMALAGGFAAGALLLVAAACGAAGVLSAAMYLAAFSGLPGALFVGAASWVFASDKRGAGGLVALFGVVATLSEIGMSACAMVKTAELIQERSFFALESEGPSALFAVFAVWILMASGLCLQAAKDPSR